MPNGPQSSDVSGGEWCVGFYQATGLPFALQRSFYT